MTDGPYRRTRPPALIRLLWLAVTAAIAYLSLYPLGDWRLRQPSPFAFLVQGLPRYYSPTDLATNVAAYVIFGLLFALGWSGRKHPWLPALLAALAGVLLSLSLEALQSYLPKSVPSMLDLSANSGGAVVGGLIGAVLAHYRVRLREEPGPVSRQWYEQGPAIGWALAVIWVISQIPAQRLLFSTGNFQPWLPETMPGLAQWLAAILPRLQELLPESMRSAHETGVVATMMCVLGVLVMDLVRSAGWRVTWIVGLMIAAVAVRVLSSPAFQSTQRLLVLLTPGAQAGLLVGALALYLVGAFRRRTRLRLGIALVVLGLLLVNLSPADPFFQATQSASQGMLTPAMTPSLRSLINGIGILWPMMVLAYFFLRLAATKRRPLAAGGSDRGRDLTDMRR
jgi:VanZ family protein